MNTELVWWSYGPDGSCPLVAPLELVPMELTDFARPAIRYLRIGTGGSLLRPELYQQDRQFDVDCDEVRASILRMFPNAQYLVHIIMMVISF